MNALKSIGYALMISSAPYMLNADDFTPLGAFLLGFGLVFGIEYTKWMDNS